MNTNYVMRAKSLTVEELLPYFDLPIEKASNELRICVTTLKKICRKLGIRKWPHRSFNALNRRIKTLEEMKKSSNLQNIEEINKEIYSLRVKLELLSDDPNLDLKILLTKNEAYKIDNFSLKTVNIVQDTNMTDRQHYWESVDVHSYNKNEINKKNSRRKRRRGRGEVKAKKTTKSKTHLPLPPPSIHYIRKDDPTKSSFSHQLSFLNDNDIINTNSTEENLTSLNSMEETYNHKEIVRKNQERQFKLYLQILRKDMNGYSRVITKTPINYQSNQLKPIGGGVSINWYVKWKILNKVSLFRQQLTIKYNSHNNITKIIFRLKKLYKHFTFDNTLPFF